jgi:anti-sigma-K factor RskA
LKPGEIPGSVKKAIGRRRRLARGALLWIEAVAAITTVAVLVISLANHFTSEEETFPGEGKRVVAFRQVTNRICTEHRGNLSRALAEARSRVERLGFVARALGWDLNDLESITPPPTKFDAFLGLS